jgi:hypothetical protein
LNGAGTVRSGSGAARTPQRSPLTRIGMPSYASVRSPPDTARDPGDRLPLIKRDC